MNQNRPAPPGLYIHIPYCQSRCGYCSFNSRPLGDRDPAVYVTGLIHEAEMARARYDCRRFETVFIGGGTPTILPPPDLERLFAGLSQWFDFADNAEISVEATPNRADFETFSILADLGVNRLSLGIQSFNDVTLKAIGRSHSSSEAIRAIKAARTAGFDNLNLDLIRGLPEETAEDWRRSLDTAIRQNPAHLSIYDLSIEPGSAFYRRRDRLALPDEDTLAAMDAITAELTAKNGFERYEISNYCRPGHKCRHNLNYWHNRPYLGLGAGAVSFLGEIRLTNTPDPDLYLRRLKNQRLPLAKFEILPGPARMRETVIMGLRMTAGVDLDLLRECGYDPLEYYRDALPRLRGQGLITWDDHYLRLTAKGMQFANLVMAELV